MRLRDQYIQLVDRWGSEIDLPDEQKTLKRTEYIYEEKRLGIMCFRAKIKAGILSNSKGVILVKISRKGKLSDEEGVLIRKLLKKGVKQRVIAKRFGISQGRVTQINALRKQGR